MAKKEHKFPVPLTLIIIGYVTLACSDAWELQDMDKAKDVREATERKALKVRIVGYLLILCGLFIVFFEEIFTPNDVEAIH